MSTTTPTAENIEAPVPEQVLPPVEMTPEEQAQLLDPESLTIAFVDQSDDVREFARDAADARLTTELNAEGGRFRRIVRNVWKGNVAREYYRQKYIREAGTNIVDTQTLYANRDDVNEGARTRAQSATIMKFVGDYEEAIHTSAGEQRKDVTAAEAAGETGADLVTRQTKDLIREYAEGRIDDAALLEARTRMLSDLRTSAGRQQLFGEGVMVADNMLEVAQNVKAALIHGESIDRVMDQIRVVSGESRSGARTEAQYNRVDKIVERINKGRIGSLMNEATVATAVSVAASMARFGSNKLATAATMTIAPGVGAGLVAGVRENKQVKDERRQHAREMATGQEYDRGNAKRRDAMQETLYETVTAESLIEDLAVQTDPEHLAGADETRLRDALDSILAAQTRIELSDARGMDLISYSSVAEVETERLVLDIALAKAKVALHDALNTAGEDVQRSLGIDTDATMTENLARLSEGQQSVLEQDISQKDAIFKALKRREVAKTTAKAALIGMGLGLVAQEVKAMIDPSTKGLVEQLWHQKNTPIDGRNHETLLHGFFGSGGHKTSELVHHKLSGNMHERVLGHGTKVSTSSEYHLEGGKGHYSLVGPTGKHYSGMEFDKNGALTPDSLHKLRAMGLTAHDKSTSTTEIVTTTRTVDVKGYLEHNRAGTTHVSRNLWYDNDTPAPKFDKNELGLQWGGANNTGMDAHGNFVFNTHAMTTGGSYHAAEQAHWQELAAQGKLKMAFSVSKDTQHQVFMVNVDASGNAIIPKGSPVSQLFVNQNGHAVFQGKYAEVVQTLGTDKTGTEHIRMLATHIGQDTAGAKPYTIIDHIPKTTVHHAYEIIGKDYNTTAQLSNFIEMAPVIPLYSRKALENLLENEVPSYYYNRDLTPAEVDQRRKRMSPRLQANPDAILDPAQEIDWYLEQQDQEHVDRIKKNLDSIDAPMSDDVEVVVTIPVAGHQEADNIYRTLEAYKGQTFENDKFEIMLYVNHPKADKQGNKLNADATLAEIERFKQDNPDMPVRVMYEALPRKDANIGYIRKVLVDSVLERNKQRGSDKDLVIVSNDADAITIHEKYLEKMVGKTMDEGVDATVGQIDWDNRAYVNYPEVHIGTRFFLMVDASMRIRDGRTGSNLGANAAFRASTYAAVGGYREGTEIAEDVDLGLDMRAAREGAQRPEVIAFGGVVGSRITTSARRAVYTWEQHADAPYHQWNYSFSADDDDIRAIQTGELKPSDFSDPQRRAELVGNVEHIINKTLESLHPAALGASQPQTSASISMSPAEEDKLVRHITRALHFMGMEFEWAAPGKIRITDGEKMLNGLHNYALRAVRNEATAQGLPTSGGMMMVNGKLRRANGQFMSKHDQEAIMANLPRIFGGTALAGA